MKKILAIIFGMLLTSMVYGQTEDVFITTTNNAILYKTNNNIFSIDNDNTSRKLIVLDASKSKKLHKPYTLQVLGLANSSVEFYFNLYIIEYKDNIYYLPKQFVENNSYIDRVNFELNNTYSQLQQQANSAKTKYDAATESYYKVSCEKVLFFQTKINQLPQMIDSVKKASIEKYKKEKDILYNNQYDKWYKKLPTSTKNALKQIDLIHAKLASPNSAGGCDYSISYINKSKKTIKYLYWDGWVYNAVDDIVQCNIRNTGHVSGRDTGPVYTGESSGGTWDCIIYNYSAHKIKLNSIDIIYTDNSSVSISGSDIKRMLSKPEKKYISWYERDSIQQNATHALEQELSTCRDSLQIWENRMEVFDKNRYTFLYTSKIQNDIHALKLCNELQSNKIDIKNANDALANFKTNNFLNDKHNSSIIEEINTIKNNYNRDKKQYQKISIGTGIDWWISSNYTGFTIPIEVLLGSINKLVNFSIAGNYTYLNNWGNEGIPINQVGATALLHLNLGKTNHIKFPLSVGIGYNRNLGNQTYKITGFYFEKDYTSNDFSFPLMKNKNNISSLISFSVRSRHLKFSIYGRFDLTPVFNKSQKITTIPKDDIFYDNYSIGTILDSPNSLPLFGLSTRYYF